MAITVITELIDKEDNFEVVRDQIALILATETASQQALATAASKDPDLWKLRVFAERSNPWEQWLNNQSDKSPIVNVWYDSGNFLKGKGDVVRRQQHDATVNIDCYGVGIASDEPAGGHNSGDKQAALEAQRALRLVRNILMAGINTNLQLPGVVGLRWPQSINVFQPQIDNRPITHIVGARLALEVSFDEVSPQFEGVTLEFLSVDITRDEDDQVIAEADFDYTL